MTKDFAQKAYEKLEMAKRNHEELRLMMAEDIEWGVGVIVLMVGDKPIAQILQEPNSLRPEYDKTDLVSPMWDKASKIDKRQKPDDFDEEQFEVTEIINSHLKSLGL